MEKNLILYMLAAALVMAVGTGCSKNEDEEEKECIDPTVIALYKIPIDSAKQLVIGKWELKDYFNNLYAVGYGKDYNRDEFFFEIAEKYVSIEYIPKSPTGGIQTRKREILQWRQQDKMLVLDLGEDDNRIKADGYPDDRLLFHLIRGGGTRWFITRILFRKRIGSTVHISERFT